VFGDQYSVDGSRLPVELPEATGAWTMLAKVCSTGAFIFGNQIYKILASLRIKQPRRRQGRKGFTKLPGVHD